jgi:hypothetical protein
MTVVWHHFIQGSDVTRRNAILQALTDAGVKTCARASESAFGPGVLFFDGVGPDLCDFVRRASRNGLERVLVVATSGSALGGDTWRLLESGASTSLRGTISASQQ